MKSISKFNLPLLLLSLFFLFLSSTSLIFAQDLPDPNDQIVDRVSNFDSQITINKDASISVLETISYETNRNKHGIYRYIPYLYKRKGLAYSTRISNIRVTDENNRDIQFSKKNEYGNVFLKIGNPDHTFTGRKTYKISYRVANAVRHFDKYDELYWDITGEGWRIDVLHSNAVVKSPYARITSAICYSGMVGTNDQQCNYSSSNDKAEFNYDLTIENGVNMTVAVALDQKNSQIVFPGLLQKITTGIIDNIILLIIILPSILLFYYWFQKGRDWQFISANVFNLDEKQPKRLSPMFSSLRVPFVYEPLKLTPGEAGAVIDQSVDSRDIVAEIIELARKKYLKIKTVEKKKSFGKVKDYLFAKLKDADAKLPKHQKYLLKSLFAKQDEVLLSSLKGSFYTKMSKVKDMIYQSLVEKKLFTSDPSSVRVLFMVIAGLVNAGIIFLGIYAIDQYLTTLPLYLSILLSAINFLLAWSMPQRTAVGTAYAMQARGLKASIKRGKWREEVKEKHLFIEEVLPFAIALGVVKQLSKAMKDLDLKPPEYLENSLLSNMLVSDFLNDFSSQAASGLSYNPSSSGYSSGSGFSGGGSSGGGGGGGGGGSW